MTVSVSKRRARWIAACVALVAAATFAAIPSAVATSSSAEARVTCPRRLSFQAVQFSADAALVAAKRLVSREYREPADRFNIVLLARLDPAFRDLSGLDEWRALATRRCGREVAGYSWVVGVDFPYSRVVLPTSVSFITHTRAGWRLWYRYR
jgi:hypothetical protein